MKNLLRLGVLALTFFAAACQRENPTPRPNKPITGISFVTDWKAQAEHGGFYQALAEGLYPKRGLDVTIREGGLSVDVPQGRKYTFTT